MDMSNIAKWIPVPYFQINQAGTILNVPHITHSYFPPTSNIWTIIYKEDRNKAILKYLKSFMVAKPKRTVKPFYQGYPLCSKCIGELYACSKSTINRRRLAFVEHGDEGWQHEATGSSKSHQALKGKSVRKFLDLYIKRFGCRDPVKGGIELTPGTKKLVYFDYLTDHKKGKSQNPPAKPKTFESIWLEFYKHVKIPHTGRWVMIKIFAS